jgi:Icc-related predicted phosphoesterase
MKIRIFSDIHVDINQKFPFSFKEGEKDTFTLIAGDVSGNPKLTAKWIKANITNGMFIVGNHDPTYNDLGWTIGKQKKYLAQKFPVDAPVTFLDESVGVMAKEIPGTNVLVVASTLYTDYKYVSEWSQRCLDDGNRRREENGEKKLTIEEMNMAAGARGLNDFRWGHVEDEFDDRGLKQRPVRPDDYKKWFEATFKRITEIVEGNPDKDIIVMTHHCPSPKCISERYVRDNMNASYVSNLEDFIFKHPNIKAWVCGHVHSQTIMKIGENGQWLICNPRGYEKEMESDTWNPNTILDTDTWEVTIEPYENKRLVEARKKFHDDFMKYAPLFF